MSTRAPTAGRAAPIVELLIPSTLDATLRRRAAMSRACSASTSAIALPIGRALGRRARARRRLRDRHGQPLRAEFRGARSSPARFTRRSTSSASSDSSGGDISHGKLSLNQLFSARPVLGNADYRMPIPGLYLCGAGAASRAVASPAFPATTRRARCGATEGCGGAVDEKRSRWCRPRPGAHRADVRPTPSQLAATAADVRLGHIDNRFLE